MKVLHLFRGLFHHKTLDANRKDNAIWAVVVAQLAERSFPDPRGLRFESSHRRKFCTLFAVNCSIYGDLAVNYEEKSFMEWAPGPLCYSCSLTFQLEIFIL